MRMLVVSFVFLYFARCRFYYILKETCSIQVIIKNFVGLCFIYYIVSMFYARNKSIHSFALSCLFILLSNIN